MRSFGGLWERMIAPETLQAAMRRAAIGKKHRAPVLRFLADADREIAALAAELSDGTYQPRPYVQFRIWDPKPRVITCAEFRDRVVHHALCDVCGPCIERRFIADSFACRLGKGAHRAVARAQHYARRNRFYFRADVKSFYDSVDIGLAVGLLTRCFREREVQALWTTILRHPFPGQAAGKGLPIGNLTSQWTANLYLDGLDHCVQEQWGALGYVRYMDDFVAWADDKDTLWWLHDRFTSWLQTERGLKMKEAATCVGPVSEGLSFLGLRVFPGKLRLQHGRLIRLRRLVRHREREYEAGESSAVDFVGSLQAATGILRFWGLKGLVTSDLDV